MSLTRLRITSVRNLHPLDLQPARQLNILYGANGSGKTSLLEAIHLLGSGKSFRTSNIRRVIQQGAAQLVVYGVLALDQGIIPIGIERGTEHTRLRIGGRTPESIAELAVNLPVQYLGPDLARIIDSGPKWRRRLMDWGVFHVEHDFYKHWSRYTRLIRQRNALLKQSATPEMIRAWDLQVIPVATAIDACRQNFLAHFLPQLASVRDELMPGLPIEYQYYPGWNPQWSLAEVLERGLESDIRRGFTQHGPHRADLAFSHKGVDVQDALSRGQLKLLIIAIKVAEVLLLKQLRERYCVILMDDLPSELDQRNRHRVLQRLLSSHAQVFVTCTDRELIQLDELQGVVTKKVFHVEQGAVKEVV
ncbi:MAG: DNA replication/repair protein RecF [Pseudomonadota bacterium]